MRLGISCYPTYGGSGVVATELGLELAARGHEVHFISYAVPRRLDIFRRNVYFHAVEVPSYPLFEYPPYSLALASVMADVAVHSKLQLIHAHYALPHAASAYLAKQMLSDRELKVVTTLHGTDITLVGNDRSFLPITRFSIDQSDAATAVSQWLADQTLSVFSVTAPIGVIPNFVDHERFQPSDGGGFREALAPDGEKVVMHVSNFRPVKRIGDVVATFARIRSRSAARLVLVGDGPERARAEDACRELKICDHVVFLGNQPDLPHLLSTADVLLLPSEHESFGLAALEAQACGVPVVCTRAGGLPEVIEHGVTGLLAPVGDVAALSEHCLSLLEDPKRAREMGQAGRQMCIERFSPGQVVDQYENLYEDLLR